MKFPKVKDIDIMVAIGNALATMLDGATGTVDPTKNAWLQRIAPWPCEARKIMRTEGGTPGLRIEVEEHRSYA